MKSFLLAIMAIALLVGAVILPTTIFAADVETAPVDEVVDADVAKIPAALTKAQEDEFTEKALSDKRVTDSIAEKAYHPVGVGFYT
ncbi:MAG: hypothetical protein ACRD4B_04900, partial [Acidobacteriota bacterium]